MWREIQKAKYLYSAIRFINYPEFTIKMLNKQEFAKIRKEIENFDKRREFVIQLSREIINLSKRVIYSLHRNDIKEASDYIKQISKKKSVLDRNNVYLDTNINKTAYQEYVEALAYFHFIKSRKIPAKASLKVSTDDYLMGLCDLTGELGRKAVNEVIKNNFKKALEIKELVEEIYGEFLKFNLRNSELRKKSDAIKWNLQKLEDLVFDIKIKGRK